MQVTVAQTCTAIAYDSGQLTALATRLLPTQAERTLGQGYIIYGDLRSGKMHESEINAYFFG